METWLRDKLYEGGGRGVGAEVLVSYVYWKEVDRGGFLP